MRETKGKYKTTSVIGALIDQAHELAASDGFWKITSRIIELRDEREAAK